MALSDIVINDGTDDQAFLSQKITDISVEEYYPGQQELTLKNGDFVSFTPNKKKRVSLSFAFITATDMDKIISKANNTWKITTTGTTELPRSCIFSQTNFILQGSNLEYSFADRYVGAGFSGTLTFLETG